MKQTEYFQVGKSAAAFVYSDDGSLRINVLNPGATEFIVDNTVWGEVYFDRDGISKKLNRTEFEQVVQQLGGSPVGIPVGMSAKEFGELDSKVSPASTS